MGRRKVSLLQLFWTFFKINAITFGGGYTIVPIIKDEFSQKLKLIDEEEMIDLVALAQSGPGAMAISTSLLTGYKLAGPLGALTCLIASVLPCLITISIVTMFYSQFKTNFFISSALVGISGIISAVLFITVYNMGKTVVKNYPIFSFSMLVGAFILSFFLDIHTGLIILLCGIIGVFVFSVPFWEVK